MCAHRPQPVMGDPVLGGVVAQMRGQDPAKVGEGGPKGLLFGEGEASCLRRKNCMGQRQLGNSPPDANA